MIVATAGHVDHGKTSLVRALTGVDTDRLPDEKRRGLTIEPGFAYLHGDAGEVLGFVDVPGHERFVANMLAGVAAIDSVLVVVAADDGVMPQTREHVAILDLLGVDAGCAAITKIDKVGPERVAEVQAQLASLFEGGSLAGIDTYPVSAVGGIGVDALRRRLLDEAASYREAALHRRAASEGRFRLSIDRSFHVAGAGLIVTGAVVGGSIGIGDQVIVSPAGRRARVRDLRVHDRPASRAAAGDRVALNLAGDRLDREQARRGAWVLDEALHAPTRTLDVRLRLLPDAPKPLKHRLPVHVHLAAGHAVGHLALLGTEPVAPGETGFAELALDQDICALAGDRFIVRDPSARRTIGGGVIVDPFATRRGRTRGERRAVAEALAHADPEQALDALLRIDGQVLEVDRFVVGRNLDPDEAARLFAAPWLRPFSVAGKQFAIPAARWFRLESDIVDALAAAHREAPDHPGLRETALANLSRMIGRFAVRPSPVLLRAMLGELIATRRLARSGPWLHLHGHQPVLGAADEALWRRIEAFIERHGLRAPALSELAQALGQQAAEVSRTLRHLEGLGKVVAVAKNRFLTMPQAIALARLAETLAASAAGPDGLTAIAFRERSGIGRNQTIEVLEYFDRAGMTRRVGAHRRLLRPSAELFGEHDPHEHDLRVLDPHGSDPRESASHGPGPISPIPSNPSAHE